MTNTETSPGAASEQGAGEGTGDLGTQIARLEAELKSAREEQLRQLAEMDNQRKRLVRDVESARRYASERLLGDLLPVADALERGLGDSQAEPAKLRAGMELTQRLLAKALESHGVSVLDPVGQDFDPGQHQAMTTIPSGQHAPGTVVSVMQKGYALHDRLLRPAMVAVSEEPPPPEDA